MSWLSDVTGINANLNPMAGLVGIGQSISGNNAGGATDPNSSTSSVLSGIQPTVGAGLVVGGALIGAAGGGFTGAQVGAAVGYGIGTIAANGGLQTPHAPNLASPDSLSKTPTQGQTNTTAIQNQLSAEQNSMATSSYLTPGGGAGLLDQPTTSSRVLLGN